MLDAIEGRVELFISVVSCIEVFYISLQEQNEKVAEERLELLNDLPVILFPLDPPLIKTTGEFKARYQMSFADCVLLLHSVKIVVICNLFDSYTVGSYRYETVLDNITSITECE